MKVKPDSQLVSPGLHQESLKAVQLPVRESLSHGRAASALKWQVTWVTAQVSPSGCGMLCRCGRAGSVTALWFVQRMLQGSRGKKKRRFTHQHARVSNHQSLSFPPLDSALWRQRSVSTEQSRSFTSDITTRKRAKSLLLAPSSSGPSLFCGQQKLIADCQQ